MIEELHASLAYLPSRALSPALLFQLVKKFPRLQFIKLAKTCQAMATIVVQMYLDKIHVSCYSMGASLSSMQLIRLHAAANQDC